MFFVKMRKNRSLLCTFAPMKTMCVATIGCFDGVHRGHQVLIRKVLEIAEEQGIMSTVITFDRQPRELFDSSFRPQLLSTPEEKEKILKDLGIDEVVVLPFTKELAGMTAQAFMAEVLRDRYAVQVLVAGYDNRFGHNRAEGFEDYVRYGKELGIEVLRGDVARFKGGDKAVSSSAIRQLLSEGYVELMPDCLTRPYSLSGEVVPGEHIGHELGFPTANLEPSHPFKLIPAAGAYAVWVTVEDKQMPAMMNIGTRPTFQGKKQTLEVNILDFEGDLYGKTVSVEFVKRLREEQRFDSPEALKNQLEEDKIRVREILR